MSEIIVIKNLKVGRFEEFNLDIKSGWTTIIGPSGSGKTTLIKAIAGIYKFQGEIKIDGLELNEKNKKQIYQNIGIVFENPDNLYFSETVYEELAFPLTNMGMGKKEIAPIVEKISSDFGLDDLLKKNLRELSSSEKQLVSIASSIIKNPKILLIDDGFNRLTDSLREAVINYLKNQVINIVHLTSSSKINLKTEHVIVLNDSKIVESGNFEVLKNDKLFSTLGLSQPFMISLSSKLSYYELVDKTILDTKEMVNKIWK